MIFGPEEPLAQIPDKDNPKMQMQQKNVTACLILFG